MLKYYLLFVLLASGRLPGLGQTLIQGDTLFRGLQLGACSLERVQARLGAPSRAEQIINVGSAKLRSGGCIPIQRVSGVSLHYPAQGLICYVNTSRHSPPELAQLVFDSTAQVSSARGVQPGKHRFRDVIARYGPIDFDKKDNTLPAVWEIADESEQWYTVLVFPTIRFVSPGRRQPGEDLLCRPITGIWLEK